MMRKWRTKNGTERVKVYETIAGHDARAYKRQQDRTYRARRRPINSGGRCRRPAKGDALTPETVARMKELHSVGLLLVKIGSVSRYVVQSVVQPRDATPCASVDARPPDRV